MNPIQNTLAHDAILDYAYPVMEHFYTIQGEGFWSGTPAYFIRLGGCDVGCVWCDVKESWDAGKHPNMSIHALMDAVRQTPTKKVVITGGEPLMYDLFPLTNALKIAGYDLHIETSGVYPLTGIWDWICFSPKKFKKPLEEFYSKADELKVIVFNVHDLAWAEEHAIKCRPETILYLQPEWSKKESMGWIVEYVKAHPKWKVSLQTHKFMDIP